MFGSKHTDTVKETSACRFCGKKLTFLQRLSKQEFCSPDHQSDFQRRQEQAALVRLMEAVQAAEPVAAPAPNKQKPDPPECGFLLLHRCTGPRQRLSECHCETEQLIVLPSIRRPVKRTGEYLPPEPGFLHPVEAMDSGVFLAEDPSWTVCLWTECGRLPDSSGLSVHAFEAEHREADPPKTWMLSPAPWTVPKPCATPLVVQSEPAISAPAPPAVPSVQLTVRLSTDPRTAGMVPPREYNLLPTTAIATRAFHCSVETWLSESFSAALPASQPDLAAREPRNTELVPYVPFSPDGRAPVDTFVEFSRLSLVPAFVSQQCFPKFAFPPHQPHLPSLEENPLFVSDLFDPESGRSAPHSMQPEAAYSKTNPWFPSSGFSPAVNHAMEPPRARRQRHTYEPLPAPLSPSVVDAPFEVLVEDTPACDFSLLLLRNIGQRPSGPPVSRGILRAPLTPRDPGATPFLDPISVNFGSPEEVWQPPDLSQP
jgi:hypothetical protein